MGFNSGFKGLIVPAAWGLFARWKIPLRRKASDKLKFSYCLGTTGYRRTYVTVKVSSHAFLSSGVEKSALHSGRFTPKERAIIARWNYDMRFEEKKRPLHKEKTCCWSSR